MLARRLDDILAARSIGHSRWLKLSFALKLPGCRYSHYLSLANQAHQPFLSFFLRPSLDGNVDDDSGAAFAGSVRLLCGSK